MMEDKTEKRLLKKIEKYWDNKLKIFEEYKRKEAPNTRLTKEDVLRLTKEDVLNPIIKQNEIILLEAKLQQHRDTKKEIAEAIEKLKEYVEEIYIYDISNEERKSLQEEINKIFGSFVEEKK